MYKTTFWILALLLISSILLVSCAQPTEAPAQPAEVEEVEETAPAEPISVSVWHMEQPPHRVDR